MTAYETLVGLIYEAAADPALWPRVMHDLGGVVDAAGGIILTRRADAWTGWRGSDAMAVKHTDAWVTTGAARSQATARLLSLNRAGFVAEQEAFEEEEWLADPIMMEWCGPLGLHHCAATAIPAPTGDLVVVQLNRRFGKPQFDRRDIGRLDVYRPHLARAGLLAARWRLERLRAAAEALALIGLPAAVLDVCGKVLAANSLIEALKAHFVWLPKDRISLADPAADELLRRAVARIADPTATTVLSFPSIRVGKNPAVVHLIPATGEARDLFSGGFAMLIVTEVRAPDAPDAALIQGLFDLTPAEARVARAIAQQKTIEGIATEFGLSRETIRTQVKSVLAKTGFTRQQNLVAVLTSARLHRPAD